MTEDEAKKQRIVDYKVAFGTEQGLRVLVDLAKFCGESSGSFVAESTHMTAYNEGVVSVIRYIRGKIDANPNAVEEVRTVSDDPEL